MGDRKLSILVDSDLEACATLTGEFDSQQTYVDELNHSRWTIWLGKPNSVFGLCVGLCWSGHSCLGYQVWISVTWFSEGPLPVSKAYDNPWEHFDKECKVHQAILDKIAYCLILTSLLCTRFTELLGLRWNLLEHIVDKRSNLLCEQTPEYQVGKQKLYFTRVYWDWSTFYMQDY